MAKQALDLGTVANDNTGDTLRAGGDKINDNFNEFYNIQNGNLFSRININKILNQESKIINSLRLSQEEMVLLEKKLQKMYQMRMKR